MSPLELREEGELPVGLELDGVVHTRYVLRAGTMADYLEVEASGMTAKGDWHMNVALLARQLVVLGSLTRPQICVANLKRLTMVDVVALMGAVKRLEARLRTFRGSPADAGNAQDDIGSGPQNGVE